MKSRQEVCTIPAIMSKREWRKKAAWMFFGMAAGAGAMSPAAEPIPTTMPSPPSEARFVITDFGAVADGKTINTKAIQGAIDHAATSGGGTIVVPTGTYLSGAIFLKPGVGLYVEKNGVLKGSTDVADYPMTRTRIEGHFQQWLPALINAEGIDHLRIGGPGTLDGSGTPFYAAFRTAIAANRSTTNLDVPRPRMVFVSNCSDARVEGLHFLNSGFWNLHVYHSHDVVIDGLDILAAAGSPSTDGIDVDSSQWVTIHGCRIANNDDGIALKGSKGVNAADDKDSPPDEHIHVYDCIFVRGGSFLTCGSEATIVRDVEVDHCSSVGDANRGITMMRLKLRTDTPQLYEDIHFHDISLEGAGTILGMAPWTQYQDLQGHAPPTHTVRNISISNVTGTFGTFGAVRPNPGDGITGLTLEDIDVKLTAGARGQPSFTGVTGLVVKNVKINGTDYTGPGN
jgi:alpha-L-rhamnosidase